MPHLIDANIVKTQFAETELNGLFETKNLEIICQRLVEPQFYISPEAQYTLRRLNDLNFCTIALMQALDNSVYPPFAKLIPMYNLDELLGFEFMWSIVVILKEGLFKDRSIRPTMEWIHENLGPALNSIGFSPSSILNLQSQLCRFAYKYCLELESSKLVRLLVHGDGMETDNYHIIDSIECHLLERQVMIKRLWNHIKKDIKRGLLHTSVSINRILESILRAHRILSQIDDSNHLLELFLLEVRAYLRTNRKDEYEQELLKLIRETVVNEKRKLQSFVKAKFDSPEIDQRNFDWYMGDDVRTSTKSGDILSILLNFFEDPDELVKEYKCYLIKSLFCANSEKLILAHLNEINVLQSRIELNILKECKVIIGDFEQSFMLNDSSKKVSFEIVKISKLYWPEFEPESFFVPYPEYLRAQEAILKKSAFYEKGKRFEWTNSQSYVELEVEFVDGTIPVSCNADEATVLILVSECKCCSAEELINQTNFSQSRLMKALLKWLQIGLIRCNYDMQLFTISEERPANDFKMIDCVPDLWTDLADTKSSNSGHELSAVLPLIRGMLSSLGAMPLGAIHAKLCQVSISYNSTESDLHRLLDMHVSSGVLYLTDEGFFNVVNKL